MHHLIFIVALAIFQDAVPFKPKEEFEIKLDYQFRTRPAADHNTVNLGTQSKTYSTTTGAGVLPYLVLEIKFLALPQEKTRITITDNLNSRPVSRRVTLDSVMELDLGFTDDMIDRVHPHEYKITFINAEKEPVNCIVISVDEDGSFLINGEKRGKF